MHAKYTMASIAQCFKISPNNNQLASIEDKLFYEKLITRKYDHSGCAIFDQNPNSCREQRHFNT